LTPLELVDELFVLGSFTDGALDPGVEVAEVTRHLPTSLPAAAELPPPAHRCSSTVFDGHPSASARLDHLAD
jgi:hypothetical protein